MMLRDDVPSGRAIVTAPSVPVDMVGPLFFIQYNKILRRKAGRKSSDLASETYPVMVLDAQLQEVGEGSVV